MKKTLLLTAATLLVGSSAIAETKKFSPYVGVQAGGAFMSAHVKSDDNDSNFEGVNTAANPSGKGLIGGVHAGFDCGITEKVSAGLELGVDFLANAKAEHKAAFINAGNGLENNGNIMSVQQRNRMNIAARIKYAVSDTAAPYLKAGYSASSFRGKSTLETAEITTGKDVKKSKVLGGFLVGAGVDLTLTDNIRAGLEYTFTQYNKMKIEHNFTQNGAQKLTRTYKPQTSVVQLRLSYAM